MKNLAIIPARSGSKGLADKNIKSINGLPLIAYSIIAAKESNQFTNVMVSTDSAKYAEIAMKYGADVPFLRSFVNSSDTASTWDVISEVIDTYEQNDVNFDTFCLLQPTSPLRTAKDIEDSYRLFQEKNAIGVVSVCKIAHPIEWTGKIGGDLCLDGFVNRYNAGRRQNASEMFRLNGAIYIMGVDAFREDNFIYREGCFAYIMPRERSIDIDSDLDFEYARFLIERRLSK